MLGTTTRTEYTVTNGVFKKHKVLLCVMGNQQKEGVHYQLQELYAPPGDEGGRGPTICGKHGLNRFKSDTKQAFLNGDIGEEKIYVRPPDWWP